MKPRILMILSVVLIAVFNISSVEIAQNDTSEVFNQSIEKWISEYDIPGVGVSIIKEGNVIYNNTFGYANIEEGVSLTESTILRTESISKTITAYLVMLLVEDGILSLDTSVNEYIDITVPEEITLHLLLTHQAGLDIGPFSLHYSPSEEMPSLRNHLINTISFIDQPGETFNYSNVGYNLIQYIIESVTNNSFNDVVKQYIFDPLSVYDASFEYNPNLDELYAMGYDINNKVVPPYVYPDKSSGGLFTDLEALTSIIQKIMTDNDFLSQEKKDLLYTSHVNTKGEYSLVSDGYGYGHFVKDGEDKAVFHGGQGHGWMAFYYGYPENQDAIIIITNSQRSYPMISGLIDLFSEELGYEKPNMAIISGGLPFATLFVVLLTIIFGFIILRIYKRLKNRVFLSLRKKFLLIIKTLILIIITLYLWITPYIFVQVLYPIHFESLRYILSIFTFIYSAITIYIFFDNICQKNYTTMEKS